ncbi:MAG: MATE family efflux transporter [Oscillospiraceae bacterium]|nr:MATE family efflux transporter [Oscillospiraceae bacterium]
MNRNLNMTKGHPAGLLIRFALPLMFGNLFQQLYTVVDTAIVGNGVGMDALAALGAVDWLNWMFLAICQGFTQGFSVRMSQKFGEGNEDGLKRTIAVSARLAVWIAAVALIVALSGLPLFLKLLRVPDDLMPYASSYSGIILAGIPAMMYFNYCAGVLRSVGDSRTPLIAMIVASLTNIVLDCIAVFALNWGIAGAAAATVLAQVLAGTVCMVKMLRTPQLRFGKRHLARDTALVKALMALGAPLAAQFVIIAVGGMAVQSVVNRFETSFIAGFTATNKLYGILEIAASSYGFAVTTYTGQNYGASLWERIRRGTNWAVLLSVLTAMLIGAVMILFGRNITMLFIESEIRELEIAAGNVAFRYLCFMSLALPVLYLLHVYRAALQGMGNANIPLWSGIVEFVIRVGASVIVGVTLWQDGIFWGEIGSWIGAAILLSIAYYRMAAKLDK